MDHLHYQQSAVTALAAYYWGNVGTEVNGETQTTASTLALDGPHRGEHFLSDFGFWH